MRVRAASMFGLHAGHVGDPGVGHEVDGVPQEPSGDGQAEAPRAGGGLDHRLPLGRQAPFPRQEQQAQPQEGLEAGLGGGAAVYGTQP